MSGTSKAQATRNVRSALAAAKLTGAVKVVTSADASGCDHQGYTHKIATYIELKSEADAAAVVAALAQLATIMGQPVARFGRVTVWQG